VVYFFLGNVRSTFITGIALPNSLLGSFILMLAMGFTVNIITLLALTLAIGLLVDDAIVVRENIFRKIESGMHPVKASEVGTNEVLMAVIASTITIIAVFLPVGFMSGIVGQFFKQFGLTMVFTMAISLFDGLFVAPMLSAYFSGKINHKPNIIIRNFRKFQDWLDNTYVRTIRFGLNNPKKVLLVVTLVFFGSLFSMKFVKGTFMPPQDMGEFQISIEVPQGSSLTATHETVKKIENKLKEIKDIEVISSVAGSDSGEANLGNIGIRMFPPGVRSMTTQQLKEHIREVFKDWKDIKLSVNDYGIVGGAGSGRFQKNFILNLSGADQEHLDAYAEKVMADMAKVPGLTEIETSSEKGKPEFHIDLDPQKMQMLGVLPTIAGTELRLHVAGAVVGKFYENGIEYDIRMRLKPEQRNLKSAFYETKVPNTNFRYIRLSDVSRGLVKEGPARIYREDRAQVVQIVANLKEGYGIAEVMTAARKILTVTNPMPKGIKYKFIGQAEEFGNMVRNFLLAFGIAIAIIYLILASLYESYITPITIFIAIPPALSGGFLALALTRSLMDMNAMIGMIMLLGIVTKNSILLVDFGLERVKRGYTYKDAILEAGRLRLRPILMTTFAMIAGTSPIAFGIGEASKQRTSMGIVIIGGLIVSTFLTLIVVPVIFELVDQFREKIERRFRPDFDMKLVGKGSEGKHS
jgi:HAE1 family hydrophobic/amphiphilic exporter-1